MSQNNKDLFDANESYQHTPARSGLHVRAVREECGTREDCNH
jgi:hypothetical protein